MLGRAHKSLEFYAPAPAFCLAHVLHTRSVPVSGQQKAKAKEAKKKKHKKQKKEKKEKKHKKDK